MRFGTGKNYVLTLHFVIDNTYNTNSKEIFTLFEFNISS